MCVHTDMYYIRTRAALIRTYKRLRLACTQTNLIKEQ
jgi:hypothetical protein